MKKKESFECHESYRLVTKGDDCVKQILVKIQAIVDTFKALTLSLTKLNIRNMTTKSRGDCWIHEKTKNYGEEVIDNCQRAKLKTSCFMSSLFQTGSNHLFTLVLRLNITLCYRCSAECSTRKGIT